MGQFLCAQDGQPLFSIISEIRFWDMPSRALLELDAWDFDFFFARNWLE